MTRKLTPLLPLLLHPLPVLSLTTWTPCPPSLVNTTLPILCTTLPVPLSYVNPSSSSPQINLTLLKLPALVSPPLGTIQLNFGGPGQATLQTLVSLGPTLQILSGGAYDLVGFDPRGTGETIPFVCTDEPWLEGGVINEARSSLEGEGVRRRLWERGAVDGWICESEGTGGNGAEVGTHLGTAAVARDLMAVVDALGEEVLHYWGFSYGTTLGATVAAMFPGRVGRMVLDGVQNPHEYYHAYADFEGWTDTDLVFSHFFAACIEGGEEKCALAGLNKTAEELEADTWAFFDSLREEPIGAGPVVFDSLTVKADIVERLKWTGGWPELSVILKGLVYATRAERKALLTTFAEGLSESLGDNALAPVTALWGIHCGDRTVRAEDFGEIAPVFDRLHNTSRMIGDVVAWVSTHCAQWPWHADEVYMGDFHVETKNPILITSNSRDAHTPLRSAQNISTGFEGSVVLEVNGSGHCIINAPSACGFRALVAYWLNGTLPEEGTLCETAKAFDPYSWKDVFEEVGATNGTESVERRAAYRRSL